MRAVANTFFAALVAISMPAAAQTSTPVTTNNGTPPSGINDILAVGTFGADDRRRFLVSRCQDHR